MNRGQDVITESQKVEKLQKRLTEQGQNFTTLDLIIRSHLGTKLSDSRKRQEDIMIISRGTNSHNGP